MRKYQKGFGGHLESETIPGALPFSQNSPQQCPMGLYAEQLSGTAFTVPRALNQRSWLYRKRPSVCAGPMRKIQSPQGFVKPVDCVLEARQLRWDPLDNFVENRDDDFVESLLTVSAAGSAEDRHGLMILHYAFEKNMDRKAFCSNDGDLLFVPQKGCLDIETEFGLMDVEPMEIAVIPRGIHFSIKSNEDAACGYLLEVYDGHFELPDLGPIGANGLANPQDFEIPCAFYDEKREKEDAEWHLITKYGNEFYEQTAKCPFDVLGWRGNYHPYKYDLRKFNTINSVSYDHPDPSIFTVLTCKSGGYPPGTALADFVIFPPRWLCARDTFRPPYFHRNCMSEFMGLIKGEYDAKEGGGFLPGGASLHSIMVPHGPDGETVKKAATKDTSVPEFVGSGSMAFMFESSLFLKVNPRLFVKSQSNYEQIWQNIP